MLILTPVHALAEVVFNDDCSIFASIINPCNGETVILSGSAHQVERVTDNGNTLHIGVHFEGDRLSGVGLTSGPKYSVQESFNTQFNLAKGEEKSVGDNFHLNGQGKTPNFVAHYLYHLTYDANGNLRSFVETDTSDCK
jgi:hypothetical protein